MNNSILVVDDEKSMRVTLSAFLRHRGYEVDVAGDVEEALGKLKKTDFDLVITDVVMPGQSGITLLQSIKNASLCSKVVMMTGEPTVDTATEALRHGAFDYLSKPVDKDSLFRVTERALEVKILEDERDRLQAENLEYQRNLEEQVKNRTRELQAAMDRLKTAQATLIKQAKLGALAEMASGIAHDFNNALMPIVGFCDVLLSEPELLDDKQETIHLLEMILAAGNDAHHIVQRLRRIYKDDDDSHKYQLLDLARLIEGALSMTMPKWKEEMNARGQTIKIETEFSEVPQVHGIASEIREILTNLIFNAVDAMPEGGTIRLRLRASDDSRVSLEISDTGLGMDEQTLVHCTDPFFTTKGDHGTGLGLPMVQGIMERHNGFMDVQSKPGQGTSIRLVFPVKHQGAPKEKDPDIDPTALAPMSVLVIDDEERSRMLISRCLEIDGHTVETAEDGDSGLRMLAAGSFDLVLTDRAMPGMNGDQVALEVGRLKPGTPVIMVTGFGDMMKDRGEIPPGLAGILGKPITPPVLRSAMAKATARDGHESQPAKD